ncbi:MAG: glycosyl transferase [candidate division WS6 bacterium 34_10]|jgi:glycosyltransferase involved in cell wall biosynthesis|uniref:Glycosyl transferase n=1 Tax=candidate division WS6 bacterium 34_10 TaxID=1641389 RepID=A0A117M058_9BACT|nr:MAG: glycosyl transferase [candidate division WS6 bacterium 34_10]
MLSKKVTAIVPAYNEEKTVGKVLDVLITSDIPDEVICVNDGSTDNTLNEIKKYKEDIVIIDIGKNKGKGNALAEGIKKASGDILLFLDADLTTLSDMHLQLLLEPLLNGKYRAVLGYLVGGSGFSLASNITGQRAYYRKDLMPHIKEMAGTKFGVEVFLNGLFSKNETKKVPLPGLVGLYKYEKESPQDALNSYIKAGVEIARVIGNKRVLPKSDFKILRELEDITDFRVLQRKIREISDTEVRDILEKYILRYIRRL